MWRKQLVDGNIDLKEFEKRVENLNKLKTEGVKPKKEVAEVAEEQDTTARVKKELEIKQLELDLQYKGFDLEQKKLDLAKQEEIIAAKGPQETIALIEKEYALRQQILNKKRDEAAEAERLRASEELTAKLQDEAAKVLERSQAIADFDNEQEMRNEELMLELQYKGFELERQKLALAEKRAIAEAEKNDYDVDAVKQEFDLRKKILNAREIAEKQKRTHPQYANLSVHSPARIFSRFSAAVQPWTE